MKTILLVLFFSLNLSASVITSKKVNLEISSVIAVHKLKTSRFLDVDSQLSLLLIDTGLSTDVAPRYKLFLTLKGGDAWLELSSTHLLSKNLTSDKIEIVKRGDDIFEIRIEELDENYDHINHNTYTLDVSKLLKDEKFVIRAFSMGKLHSLSKSTVLFTKK